MPFFRKKPVVIEAMQFDGSRESAGAIEKWSDGKVHVCYKESKMGGNYDFAGYVEIETEEGVMRGNTGDSIIKGVKGEYYPCKPDIFEATYESALQGE